MEGGSQEQLLDIGLQLATELEEKNRLLDEYANDQPIDKVVQARVQQLAITKVLVKIHGRHKSLLVKAHCDLGESYLLKEFFEQALFHFSLAKEINSGLFAEYDDSKQFHPFILMMIGKCHVEQQKYGDAIEHLEKALQMNEQQISKDHVSNVNIITDLAFAYSKKSNHQKALTLYTRAIGIVEKSLGPQSETLASLCLDVAKTQEALNNYGEAVKFQQKALDILKTMESTDGIVLANICITLAEWCDKTKQNERAVDAVKGSLQIYQDTYGENDMKTCKVREKAADIMHNAGHLDNAIDELKKVEQAKRATFGDNSTKVGIVCRRIALWLKENKKDAESSDYANIANKILAVKKSASKKGEPKFTLDSGSELGGGNSEIKGSEISASSGSGSAKKSKGASGKKGKRLIIRKADY